MAYGDYNDEISNYEYSPPDPPMAPPALIPAATAPPIYAGKPGTSYTGFDGQQGTVPQPPATSSLDQTMWRDLWTQSGQNPQAFVQGVIGKLGLHGLQNNPTALNTILRALQAVGVNAALDTRTDGFHKGIMLDGQFVKLLDGNNNWIWGPGGDAPSASSRGANTGGLLTGSVLAPFTEAGPNIGVQKPFSFDKFRPTTAEDVFADPSFDFRFKTGNRSVMAQRTARGLAKTGGTLKALDRYGQDFGSQEFSNVDARRYRDYTTGYGQARDTYDVNEVAPNNTLYSRGLTDYLNRRDTYYKNQANAFDRPYAVARLGLDANA